LPINPSREPAQIKVKKGIKRLPKAEDLSHSGEPKEATHLQETIDKSILWHFAFFVFLIVCQKYLVCTQPFYLFILSKEV